MEPFEKCPVCSGKLNKRKVEKLLRGGNSTASVMVFADVCMHCGERLYSQDVVQKFEQIRAKLAQQDTSEFVEAGKAYQIARNRIL
ncbi:MAG: YgiT-type zinc finger protein [Nitrospinae bacterium]|nr:YgiT-type zinc finger protein [Nitrospinota bacterium]